MRLTNKLKNRMKLIKYDEVDSLEAVDVRSLYRQYVNVGFTNVIEALSNRKVLIDKAEGVWMYSNNGDKILDVTGGMGVLTLGHNHPEIIQARINFQEKRKMEVNKLFFNPYQGALAHNIASLLKNKLKYSFFCNSGSEAIDGAIKIAYKYHNKSRQTILCSDIAYHGKLIGAGSLTNKRNYYDFPSINGVKRFRYNDIESVKKLIEDSKNSKNTSDIYAIFIEPYSASNLRACSDEFLRELRVICSNEKIILVFDEIFTGWYKTGPLFNFMRSGIYPDVLTVSKAFGGGKSSISAYISTQELFIKSYGKPSESQLHSSTYNGFAEECATALKAIEILERDDYGLKVKTFEKAAINRFNYLLDKYPDLITNYESHGGIHTFSIATTYYDKVMNFLPPTISQFRKARNLTQRIIALVFCDLLLDKYNVHTVFGGNKEIKIALMPSLTIKDVELDFFFEALEGALREFSVSSSIINVVINKLISLYEKHII